MVKNEGTRFLVEKNDKILSGLHTPLKRNGRENREDAPVTETQEVVQSRAS